MSEPKKCPVCGETDPYPAWFCMMRATGNAAQGKPCSYSREGNERMRGRIACNNRGEDWNGNPIPR